MDPLLASIVGFAFFFSNARSYNLISLGDETAVSMGVDTVRLKRWTMLVVAFVTGILVSCCGIIGLVGFVIPHIVRILTGANHRRLILLSFLVGCVFLVWMWRPASSWHRRNCRLAYLPHFAGDRFLYGFCIGRIRE